MQEPPRWIAPGPADEAVLFQVFAANKAAEFAPMGLPPEQLQALLQLQYDARNRSYRLAHPGLQTWLLRDGETTIGSACLADAEGCVHLVDVGVLPAFQGAGWGTRFLRQLQAGGKPIKLHVAAGNPAIRLYQRAGFVVTGERPPYFEMTWP